MVKQVYKVLRGFIFFGGIKFYLFNSHTTHNVTEYTTYMKTLHHYSQFAPNTFTLPALQVSLEYSRHALDRAMQYGLKLLGEINLSEFKVIEIEFTDGAVTKLLIRGEYSKREDILIALIPGRNFVKTCWTNRKNDNHRTLDMSKYNPVN